MGRRFKVMNPEKVGPPAFLSCISDHVTRHGFWTAGCVAVAAMLLLRMHDRPL